MVQTKFAFDFICTHNLQSHLQSAFVIVIVLFQLAFIIGSLLPKKKMKQNVNTEIINTSVLESLSICHFALNEFIVEYILLSQKALDISILFSDRSIKDYFIKQT